MVARSTRRNGMKVCSPALHNNPDTNTLAAECCWPPTTRGSPSPRGSTRLPLPKEWRDRGVYNSPQIPSPLDRRMRSSTLLAWEEGEGGSATTSFLFVREKPFSHQPFLRTFNTGIALSPFRRRGELREGRALVVDICQPFWNAAAITLPAPEECDPRAVFKPDDDVRSILLSLKEWNKVDELFVRRPHYEEWLLTLGGV